MDRGRWVRSPQALGCCLALSLFAWASPASATTQTWDTYVYGGYQWVVPAGVTSARFDLSGASGAAAGGSKGGLGGETKATIAVTPGESLNIEVGAAGYPHLGGEGCMSNTFACNGGGGGGASAVRRGGVAPYDYDKRVLVAGGGGGAGGPSEGYCDTITVNGQPQTICATSRAGGDGGDGGGLTGTRGSDGANAAGGPGTMSQTTGGCGGGGGTQSGAVDNSGDACNHNRGAVGPGPGPGGSGGDPSCCTVGGGGNGGAGYFGGYGGDAGDQVFNTQGAYEGGGGGGGGGGSSFAAPSATGVSILGGMNLGDGSVSVTYTLPTHTLTVTRSGPGSVKSSPGGIACGAACAHAFTAGSSVTLTATPAAGATFAGWSGACSGKGSCSVSMSGDRAVKAAFSPGPPNTVITGILVSAKQHRATFKFTGSGGVAPVSFKCRLNTQRVFHTCQSPATYANLTPGTHTFLVRAVDSRGMADPSPARRTFTT